MRARVRVRERETESEREAMPAGRGLPRTEAALLFIPKATLAPAHH